MLSYTNFFISLIFVLIVQGAWSQNTYRAEPGTNPTPSVIDGDIDTDFDYDDTSSGLIAVTYGNPAGLNFSFMYFYDRVGFQFSTSIIYPFAIFLDEISESDAGTQLASDFPFMAQLNLTAKIYSDDDTFVALGVMGGTSVLKAKPVWVNPTNRYFYTGPSLHYVHKHFFVEFGYAFARDITNDVNFQVPIYQTGVSFNF